MSKHLSVPLQSVSEDDGPLRVLVVSDDEDERLLITGSLSFASHEVVASDSALHAVRALRTFDADVILLRDAMPDLDSAAAIRLFRSLPGHGDIPVILVTEEERSIAGVWTLGANGVAAIASSPRDLAERVAAAAHFTRNRSIYAVFDLQLLLAETLS
jgi:CheY-like chemotaxis protein